MCCGASFARNVQVMSRPWLISCPLTQRDRGLSLELAADLTMQRLLVALLLSRSLWLDRQKEVGPLLLEELKNGF
jgi:hypothetical protein